MWIRAAAACAIGLLFGLVTHALLSAAVPSMQANDFTYPWLAARAILEGKDPYQAVRATATPWGGEFFYPLPAAVVALPFAAIPARLAGSIFVAVGAGGFSFFASRRSMTRLLLLFSAPAFHVCRGVQWSPLLAAGALFPPMLGLVVVKPNLALPLLAFQTRRRAIVLAALVGILLLAASFAIAPGWLFEWLSGLRTDPNVSQYTPPILHPLGAVMLVALLRWRRPEARLLFAMACVPQNGFFYDQFPLLLVPQTTIEIVLMTVASHVAYYAANHSLIAGGNVPSWSATFYPYMIAGLYLPALIIVLSKPNAGAVPRALEERIKSLPLWIRGVPEAVQPVAEVSRQTERCHVATDDH
jgi:hypothetical protein